jgi:hypothetical protein
MRSSVSQTLRATGLQLRRQPGGFLQVGPGHAAHLDAHRREATVAPTVLVEGPGRAVEGLAVELDGEPRVGLVGVGLVPGERDASARPGQSVVGAKAKEESPGPAAREARVGAVGGKDAPQAMPSPAPGQAREGGLDRIEIEEPAQLRLVHGVAEPALADHVRQVYERASHAGRGVPPTVAWSSG